MEIDFQKICFIHLWHDKCKVYGKTEDKSLVLSEAHMRSDLVFGAIKQIPNRYLLSRVMAKATRSFHRPGVRIEDTTNDVFERCGRSNPMAMEQAVRTSTTAEARRSRPHSFVGHRVGIVSVLPAGENSKALLEPSRVLVA
jgi:hypothetical protein